MSRRGSASNWKPASASSRKTAEKSVNTCEELMLCAKCQARADGNTPGGQKVMLKEYLKSIEYINSCHSLLNQIVAKQESQNNFTLPDIPNFVNVFSMVYNQFAGDGKRGEVEGKHAYKRHELDNIESLDEIYSRIDSLDADEELMQRRTREEAKSSSIPRPVSCEKTEKLKGARINEDSDGNTTPKVQKKRIIRHDNKAVMLERSKNKFSGELSEEDLDKYAKELLRSRSQSPSTPRSLSSNSRSISPDNTYRTKKVSNARSISVRQKLKSNSVPPKITYKLQQKVSPTLTDKPVRIQESINNDVTEFIIEENDTILSPFREKIKLCEDSEAETKMPEESDADDTLNSPKELEKQTLAEAQNAEHRFESVIANATEFINSSKQLAESCCEEPSKQQQQNLNVVVYNENASEFEKQRRFLSEKLLELERLPELKLDAKQSKHRQQLLKQKFVEEVKRQLFPESDEDLDTEGDAKTNNLIESDDIADEEIFEKRSIKSNRSSKQEPLTGGVNNTYNLLKMSISRPLRTKSVLSNIGILMNGAKTPAKPEPKPRLKPAQKQSPPFRQPRNRLREAQSRNGSRMRMGSNFSSPSSEIKSDEEEVRSRMTDGGYRSKF